MTDGKTKPGQGDRAMRIPAVFLGVAAIWAAGAAAAEEVNPLYDFTFRRVKAPEAGAARRITVQIDPAAQAAYLALPRPEPVIVGRPALPDPVAPGDSAYDWYWTLVSPSLGAVGSARLDAALAHLASGPGGRSVPAPRLEELQSIASDWGNEILLATAGTRVSPALVLAVIDIESAGRTAAVSPAGARGLMQLIPATASRFGVDDSLDPAQNIRGGVAYLDWLMGEFAGDPLMVLAAYNAGENAVRNHAGVPPYAETRAYVPKVLAAWQVARALCMTPPELISDGCVFAVRDIRSG